MDIKFQVQFNRHCGYIKFQVQFYRHCVIEHIDTIYNEHHLYLSSLLSLLTGTHCRVVITMYIRASCEQPSASPLLLCNRFWCLCPCPWTGAGLRFALAKCEANISLCRTSYQITAFFLHVFNCRKAFSSHRQGVRYHFFTSTHFREFSSRQIIPGLNYLNFQAPTSGDTRIQVGTFAHLQPNWVLF